MVGPSPERRKRREGSDLEPQVPLPRDAQRRAMAGV